MVSMCAKHNHSVSFGRDFHYKELSGLYERQPEVLFDVGSKIGAREIKKDDGAQNQLILAPYEELYKRKPDAAFDNAKLRGTMESDSYVQVMRQVLEWPKVEKRTWTLDLNLLNQFAQGSPKAIAKAGFGLGSGAFDPRQMVETFDKFHKQPLMIFNGASKALAEFERRAREMFEAEHPARAFLTKVFHR